MPATVLKTTGILQGLVSDNAVSKAAEAKTDHGTVQVPPGLNMAVAQVEKCGFANYKTGKNQGKPYWFVSAIICEPETFPTPSGIVKVRGLYIRKQIGLTESTFNGQTTTVEDRITEVVNELRCINGDSFTRGWKTTADIERGIAKTEALKPFFRFSSWLPPAQEGRTSQVVFILHEPAVGYKGPQQSGVKGMQDNSPKSTTNGTPSPSGGTSTTRISVPDTASQEGTVEFDEFGDILSLGERAATEDREAQKKLEEIAEEQGVYDEWKAIEGWEASARFLLDHKLGANAKSSESASEENPDESPAEDGPSDDDDRLPIKNNIYKWYFKNKNGEVTKKPLKVRVDTVNLHDNVCEVTDIATNKQYKKPGARFDELKPME